MSDEERIRAYVRGRADVPVPNDLRWPTAAPASRRGWAIWPASAWGRVAVAGLVMVVVAAGVFSSLQTTIGPAGPSGSPSSGSPSTGRPPATGFPSTVDGLPVTTVAHAIELLRAGKLDGQAIAVAGYIQEFVPSCPYPGRYIGPLESWCGFNSFADTRAGAQICQPEGSNGMSCHQPAGASLAPFFMSETSGEIGKWLTGGPTDDPAALVVIGHAGDPRQWQCTASTQGECAKAFVVDRIAWAAGTAVSLAAPETGDGQSGTAIKPRMTLTQAAGAAAAGGDVVAAAAFRAGDVATVDPRWNLAGDEIVWLIRSLAQGGRQGDATRPETVSLVDDATGKLIGSRPMKVGAEYQPARLWQMVTLHGPGLGCCSGNELAYYRVTSEDGTTVYDGLVPGGTTGTEDTITFGGSYGSPPLVLLPGRYSITAWLASRDGATSTPRDTCSTQVALRPLDNVVLDADYPSGKACTFGPAPSPSPGG